MQAINAARAGMQNNGTKGNVRHSLLMQVNEFQKVIKNPIHALELPAEYWIFTKYLMQTLGTRLAKVYALEGSANTEVFKAVAANKPKSSKIELWPRKINLNEFIADYALILKLNVIWADYCGHPAYVNVKTGEYTFPNMDTFVNFVNESNSPALYYMTFCCNAMHLKFGVKGLKNALNPAAADIPSAIIDKLDALLQQSRVSHKAKLIFKFAYMGGKAAITPMLTIGYAVNVKLPAAFPLFNENRLGAPKALYQSKAKLTKKAILTLLEKGMTTSDIVHAINVNPMQVAGIRASLTRKANAEYADTRGRHCCSCC